MRYKQSPRTAEATGHEWEESRQNLPERGSPNLVSKVRGFSRDRTRTVDLWKTRSALHAGGTGAGDQT